MLKLKSWPIFPLHDVICLILLSFISLGTADIVNIYWNKEQLCRKITKTMSYYVPFQQGLFMVYFVYPFYCIHTGDVDTSTWPRLFRTAVPFRTDVIWGWYLGMVFGVVSSLQYEPCVHILYIFNNVPILLRLSLSRRFMWSFDFNNSINRSKCWKNSRYKKQSSTKN